MVLFKSKLPDVQVPENLTIWDWLFEFKETSPLYHKSDKPLGAYIDAVSRDRLDWSQVKSKCAALSTVLVSDFDLQPGDTVTLFSGNSIWYPVCMFATLRAGARFSGASPAYTVDEMQSALQIARSKVIITTPIAYEKAVKAAGLAGISRDRVLLSHGSMTGVKSIQQLIESGDSKDSHLPYSLPTGVTNRDLCGFLNFSSGTTGLPKAVMLSHHNIIAQCYITREIQVDPAKIKILAVLPLFHVTGMWRLAIFPVFMNGDAVMLPSYSLQGMLQATVDFQIEELVLVPPILLRLARDPLVKNYDLRHLKQWGCGAAPISFQVLKSLEERFPWTTFRQGYGATEAPCVATQPLTHFEWKYAVSVGMLLSNTVAKVIDLQGTELGPGETGEILIKGPQVAMGYLNNLAATAMSFDSDGFYHTGDAGHFDEEGLLFITDRIKELIKVKGHQVAPAELEDLLLGHELVADCAITSMPDDYAGELPKAFVVLKPGVSESAASKETLIDYVRSTKVSYKWIKEVEFIDKIPKSLAGKILRRQLKDLHKDPRRVAELIDAKGGNTVTVTEKCLIVV